MAKSKKLKQPAKERGVKVQTPSDTGGGSTQHQCPVFSLEHVKSTHCLSSCNQEEKAAFADTMLKMSRTTWGEIQASGRHKRGCETIARNSIRDAIPDHITPDVNLLSFRFYGMAPMVGYREGRTFHVVWFDRTYTLYSH